MRTFYLTFSIWHDPYWRANLRRSWKRRRYWLAHPIHPTVKGHAFALQFGALTFTITVQGASNG